MHEKNKKEVWIKLAVMAVVVIGVFAIFLRRCHYGSMRNRETEN